MIDLFGNKITYISTRNHKKEKVLFDDYDGFEKKFETKKTTDDCYTPAEVYDCVLKYVSAKCNIKGAKIIRPFFPGGDYENIDYPENCVVVDNPPFSIISKIAAFYISKNIKFFLFAPHLTLFSSTAEGFTRIVVGASVVYENGAKVRTSFISNLFEEDIAIMSDSALYEDLSKINDKERLPKYKYPQNVVTVSQIQWCVERGISMIFKRKDIQRISVLDSQKPHKKSIFGSGYLISEKAAAEKAAAEKAAAEKAAAEKAAEKAAAEKEEVIIWELSKREKEIIKNLNNEKI